jgi:uridine kinase
VLVVAIDGRGGAGKSTLARAVAAEVGASAIEGDDFYAGGTAAEWDQRTAEDKAARCIDWPRQRAVLEAVRRGEAPTWRSYDWDAFDGRLAAEISHRPAAPIVIFEGVYSARPELADLLDLRVVLDTPTAIRRQQLLDREGDDHRADWEGRWAEAEDHYFGIVMPPEAFDLVLPWTPVGTETVSGTSEAIRRESR